MIGCIAYIPGARAFTPLTSADDLYTPYLKLVSHPKSGSWEDLATELRRVVAHCGQVPRLDVMDRARRRLALMGYDEMFRPADAVVGGSHADGWR